jgi:hypothetical protein
LQVFGIEYEGSFELEDMIADVGPRSKFSPLATTENNVKRAISRSF